jgi:guanylate kinase
MKDVLNRGSILILSGPSGCGKSSLLKELYKQIDDYYFSISTTTRDPRVGEKDGVDYYFVSKDEFEDGIDNHEFLEYALVHHNFYGTSLKPINKALDEGKLVIFDIDVQGHDLVRNKLNDITTSVFITTPTLEELEKRLNSRNTDDKDVIKRRLENAKEEIEYLDKYDYVLVNDDLEKAAKKLISIANASRCKSSLFNKKDIISKWYNK